jgi:hypothetical protein
MQGRKFIKIKWLWGFGALGPLIALFEVVFEIWRLVMFPGRGI